MKQIYIDLIVGAVRDEIDPVQAIFDHMNNAGTHISRTQAEKIVENFMNKKVFAVSKVAYRAIALYEPLSSRVAFFLGTTLYSAPSPNKAEECIDEWYDLKKN